MRKDFITIGFLISLAVNLFSQSVDFRIDVSTHMNSANYLVANDDTLFAATSGGLIVYDIARQQPERYTVVNGIYDHHLTAMTRHRSGLLILGSLSGKLSFLDLAESAASNDVNLEGDPIVDVLAVEDTLWVLSRNFVSVYLYNNELSRFQFRESYQEFGQSLGEFTALAYAGRRIWLGNAEGLVSAPANFLAVNLYAEDNWDIQTTADGLPSNRINDILADPAGGQLYIATDQGLSIYDFNGFSTVTAGLPSNRQLRKIAFRNGTLYAANTQVVFQLDGSTFGEYGRIFHSSILDLEVDAANRVWVSIDKRGLQNLTSGDHVYLDGPLHNNIGEVLVDRRGRVWCSAGGLGNVNRQGIFVLTDQGWVNHQFYGGMNGRYRDLNSSNPVFEDQEGNIWVGSWGGGIAIFDPELNLQAINPIPDTGRVWVRSLSRDDTISIASPPELQSRISPVLSADGLSSVITDIYYDSRRGSIWLLNYFPTNGFPLIECKVNAFSEALFDDAAWDYYSGPFARNEVHKVRQDPFGDYWVSTSEGVVQLRLAGDTLLSANYREADNLKSNATTSIGTDDDGYVWVGTRAGLNAILGGTIFDFRETYQPIGLNINDIHVDSRNNKWFATDKGLSILLSSGSPFDPRSWIDIVPRNSSIDAEQLALRNSLFQTDLPSENILSVYLDEKNGDVYLGTDAGLAIIRNNPFASTFNDYTRLQVGPNPFVLNGGGSGMLNFYNLVPGSEVKILTANGQLIRILYPDNFDEVRGGLAQWDGKNSEGRLVASGVYLYLLISEEGQHQAGKVLVIRK